MNIGFDLDKVLIDYPPFIPSRIIDRMYRETTSDTLIYRIPSKPEQFFRLLTHIPILRQPIKKNIVFIGNLKKGENKYFLISSRFGFLRKRTEELTKRLGFQDIFSGMYFNYENKQPHLFKEAVMKTLSLDKYIDDDIHLIRYLSEKFPKTKFYWLTYKNEKITKNIFAVSDIAQIFSTHTDL